MFQLVESVPNKRCPRCRLVKPMAEFRPRSDRTGEVQSYCRPCFRDYQRARGPRKRTHEHHRKKCLKKKYGITPEQYNELFVAQGGVCAICGSAEAGNPYGILQVEHNHETGEVRGLVCQPCNIAIMWYENFAKHPHKERIIAFLKGDED